MKRRRPKSEPDYDPEYDPTPYDPEVQARLFEIAKAALRKPLYEKSVPPPRDTPQDKQPEHKTPSDFPQRIYDISDEALAEVTQEAYALFFEALVACRDAGMSVCELIVGDSKVPVGVAYVKGAIHALLSVKARAKQGKN